MSEWLVMLLTWFGKESQQRYPRLFRVAMDILPIQSSSVPCERAFSSSKETITPRRNRISAELMESLQILKYSYKQDKELNFTEGMGEAEEIQEFESLAAENVPEDIRSYTRSLGAPL
jgi:sialic acid synthase SpsE